MRKLFLFTLFLSLFATTNAQEWIYEEKALDVCHTPDVQRDSIYGVIKIDETIGGLSILMYHDTNLGVMEVCRNGKIKKGYIPNSIKVGDNAPVRYAKEFEGKGVLENYIPEKIFYLENKDHRFIVMKLYAFFYNSINGMSGGYNYFIVRLDKENMVKGFSISTFYHRGLSKENLIKLLEKSFIN
ncbi:hypothetical protein D0T84_14890 [Dysgonomonas sp. 521]|uniref:hypothetical protein n=1 Tax=Dysgonomonas sp. 521 TaxID=2302932 RepID=UPI0013D4C28F|nr:hypothetical protein [Dysgonomonas sp. 521]NDV96188.1 hypothetical protein [Dysgonomonas sp. 521]